MAEFDSDSKYDNITYATSKGGKIGMAYLYGTICLVGIPGNMFVLFVLSCILYKLTDKHKHMYIYLFALSVVDLLVLLSVTLLITDVLLQNWIFGWFMCKLFTCMESFGKLNSSFILTALSFDRFVAICLPSWGRVRSVPFALATISILTIISIILLGPLWFNAEPVEIGPITRNNKTIYYTNVRCVVALDDDNAIALITLLIFLVGFCLPASLMIFFYTGLLCKISLHSRRMENSHIPVKRVTVFTLVVVIFYFICWTPFWSFNMLLTWKADFFRHNIGYSTLCMVVLSLPQIGSSVNWIAYSLLNRQLRRSAEEAVEWRPSAPTPRLSTIREYASCSDEPPKLSKQVTKKPFNLRKKSHSLDCTNGGANIRLLSAKH